jgi:hypothetical protein
MLSRSAKTLRVTAIPSETQEQQFTDFARRLAAVSVNSVTPEIPTSLASQYGEKIGTISLPSTELKKRALADSQNAEWKLDDDFSNLTILCSPGNADLE